MTTQLVAAAARQIWVTSEYRFSSTAALETRNNIRQTLYRPLQLRRLSTNSALCCLTPDSCTLVRFVVIEAGLILQVMPVSVADWLSVRHATTDLVSPFLVATIV
jgi:hypothetical protein